MENTIIQFKGMPLFQRAKFTSNFTLQGELKEVACFFYMVEGNMYSYDHRGEHKSIHRNSILKSCGRYVQRFIANENKDNCEAIAVFLYPDLIKEIYKNEVPSFLKLKEVPMPRKLIGNQLVERYMNNLSIYFESPETFDEELGILKLKELILILLKSENHLSLRQLLSEIFTPAHIELKQVIENNLYNNLTIDQLAFLCAMSLSTFKREFKKIYNETPARYIKNRRLEKAAKLLLTTDDSILNISFAIGLEDSSTFSAIFKDKFNQAPSQYRNELK